LKKIDVTDVIEDITQAWTLDDKGNNVELKNFDNINKVWLDMPFLNENKVVTRRLIDGV